MNRAQLQGIPWHNEQMKRSCNYGSTYCLYNKNICTCKGSPNYHQRCKGKGFCEDFESRGNTAKVVSSFTCSIKEREKQITKREERKCVMNENNTASDIDDLDIVDETGESSPDETPEDKFKRVSKPRIDKTVNCIRTIANLSNRNIYSYTEDEVDKMFDHLQRALDKAKKSFKQEKFMEEFKWEP